MALASVAVTILVIWSSYWSSADEEAAGFCAGTGRQAGVLPKSDSGTIPTVTSKRKVSLTLDADIVDELGDSTGMAISSQVNEALRREISRRRHQRALGTLLGELAAEDGPLDTGELEEVGRYEELLGGR